MECPQRQKRVRALGRPVHARAFEPLADDGPASAFNDSRTDEPSIPPIDIVLHPVGIAAEVFEFPHGVLPKPVPEPFPNRIEHAFDFARLDATFPVVMLFLPLFRSLLESQAQHQRFEMFDGMKIIQDSYGKREVLVVNGPQPLGTVGDVENRFGALFKAPVELRAQEFAEFLASLRGGDIGRRIEIAVGFVFQRL